MTKNVLPKYWNGSEFEELHIVTKASNVFTNDNKSAQQKIDDFTSHLTAAAPHSGHETPAGAQAKADATLNLAKQYTDQEVGEVAQELAELVSTKSSKSTIQTKTLSAVSWVGSEIPYTYTLSVTGVTPTSVQEILPTTDITADQLSVLISATIQDGGQSSNTIVLKAWGTKPTIDLPIRIILRGDM